MTFLSIVLSKEWTISKMVPNLLRHRDFADRKIDGAVHWSSLCSKLRCELESEGARTFSDWIRSTEEATKLGFNAALTRTTSYMFAPSKVTQELIASELNHVAIPLGKNDMWEALSPNSCKQNSSQVEGTQGGRRYSSHQTLFGDTEEVLNDDSSPRKRSTTRTTGKLLMQSVGSILEKHKVKK